MKSSIANGWLSLKSQFYVVIILFLYHLIFGYFLYRLVDSAVVPLLQRYPDPPPNDLSQILFYIEGQMDLTHSHTVHNYLWILLGMLLFRMILTPFIHSGIFYGLHQERKGEIGAFFFKGMKQHWKCVTLFYWIETLLALIPAYWLVPKLYSIAMTAFMSPAILMNTIPYIVGWYIYGYVIHQFILYMQFGATGEVSILSSIFICLRHALSVVGISLILGSLSLVLFCLFTGLSLFWTGLFALILQQAYPFVTCLFKMWNITSQFSLWNHKLSKNK